MKKVIIAGSAALQEQATKWVAHWREQGYEVLDYPVAIPATTFMSDYPQVYRDYFERAPRADLLFVMNEDKNGIPGYIGAETFAEMCYVVANNQTRRSDTEVILYQTPDERVQSAPEVKLWLELGWIRLFDGH